ncbi:benzoate 4-monooxygenase cytochrome P450 [Aspergillus karnatakaensis]|uniref:benzoate 4-monooxygenase cytochrome P450 n=1 Tax=Aspergillus karnatakaensis TaxID=1810916 RepID=UPI003CCDEDA5
MPAVSTPGWITQGISSAASDGLFGPITAFVIGIALHLSLFRRGEWDVSAHKIPLGLFVCQLTLFFYALFATSQKETALWVVTKLSTSLLGGLTISILVYRARFHRLGKFPGPFAARLSTWYIISLRTRYPDTFNAVRDLNQRYGDIVRTGPTEISITHPDAINIVHSGRSRCTKRPWYSLLHPFISLFHIREKAEHTRRRKPWELAFRPEEYHCVRDNKKHLIMEANDSSNALTGVLSQVVWLISFIEKIPGLNKDINAFIEFSHKQVSNRERMETPSHCDVFSWLKEDFDERGTQTHQSRLDLAADASLVLFAGSGTVAITIIGTLYFLATASPHHLETVREEIDSLDKFDSRSLSQLPHLNAIIKETPRLHYPALTGFQRQTPLEGIQIADTYIPGNVNVRIPFYTLFRDERNFEAPEEFIPERLTNKPHLVRNDSSFTPFLIGPYTCPGKGLALVQVRHVVGEIVRRYDFNWAPGVDPGQYWASRTDGFIMGLGPLNLVFEDRMSRLSS